MYIGKDGPTRRIAEVKNDSMSLPVILPLMCLDGKGRGKIRLQSEAKGCPGDTRDIGGCNRDQHSPQVQLAQASTEREAHETAENHVIWAKNAERCQGKELPERIPDL